MPVQDVRKIITLMATYGREKFRIKKSHITGSGTNIFIKLLVCVKLLTVSANSGISGIIEASGVIVGKTLSSKEVLLIGKFFQNDFKTFYTKYGDLFVGLCAVLLLGLVLIRLRLGLIVSDKV